MYSSPNMYSCRLHYAHQCAEALLQAPYSEPMGHAGGIDRFLSLVPDVSTVLIVPNVAPTNACMLLAAHEAPPGLCVAMLPHVSAQSTPAPEATFEEQQRKTFPARARQRSLTGATKEGAVSVGQHQHLQCPMHVP